MIGVIFQILQVLVVSLQTNKSLRQILTNVTVLQILKAPKTLVTSWKSINITDSGLRSSPYLQILEYVWVSYHICRLGCISTLYLTVLELT